MCPSDDWAEPPGRLRLRHPDYSIAPPGRLSFDGPPGRHCFPLCHPSALRMLFDYLYGSRGLLTSTASPGFTARLTQCARLCCWFIRCQNISSIESSGYFSCTIVLNVVRPALPSSAGHLKIPSEHWCCYPGGRQGPLVARISPVKLSDLLLPKLLYTFQPTPNNLLYTFLFLHLYSKFFQVSSEGSSVYLQKTFSSGK